MEFPLTEEIINQIIFAMEDQRHEFLVHRHTGDLTLAEQAAERSAAERSAAENSVAENTIADNAIVDNAASDNAVADNRVLLIPIPRWQPIDGFNLMESFVAKLRNPIFRQQLKEALSCGSGVFRAFKNTLKQNKEIERLWFSFKEREMRQLILRWYNQQRELAGLERIGAEPEDSRDLLLSDFSIREATREDLEAIFKLDRKAFQEMFPDADPERVEAFYWQSRGKRPNFLGPQCLLLIAESPGGGFSGFAWGREGLDPLSGRRALGLMQLAVARHYRGLGLARMLMECLTEQAYARGLEKISIRLMASTLTLGDFFQALGYETEEQTLSYDLLRWERDQS